jgi:hypothetical protein
VGDNLTQDGVLVFPLTSHPTLITLIASELFLVIVRSGDISVLAKTDSQRTADERAKVSGGLLRSLVLEFFVFVPASAGLVLLLLPLVKTRLEGLFSSPNGVAGFYALLGLVSYGFPFALIRRAVTRIALVTLKEFADLQAQHPAIPASADSGKANGV